MGRIVVGVDGSEASIRALEWAIAEARIRDDELEVVHAWQIPIPAMTMEGAVSPAVNVDLRAEAEQAVARSVKSAFAGDPDVPVTISTPNAPAGSALIDASKGADLLVVASRGHGGFVGLLLGSVGQQCAQHAHCPTVVVRP